MFNLHTLNYIAFMKITFQYVQYILCLLFNGNLYNKLFLTQKEDELE